VPRGPIGSHADKLLIGRNLAEQVGQYRGVANTAAGDLDRTDLQRFLIYSIMYVPAAVRKSSIARLLEVADMYPAFGSAC
jgi:hypothetical protein